MIRLSAVLFCILNLTWPVAHAGNIDDLADRVQRMEKACLQGRDWSQVACRVQDLPKDDNGNLFKTHVYLDGVYRPVFEILTTTSGLLSSLSHEAVETAQTVYGLGTHPVRNFKPTLARQGYRSGRTSWFKILSELSEVSQKHHLEPCQRACLSQCAALNLLDYSYSWKEWKVKASTSPAYILAVGEGSCTEYSLLGVEINRALGVSSDRVTSVTGRHAFARVWSDGKPYYLNVTPDISPENQCIFYPGDWY